MWAAEIWQAGDGNDGGPIFQPIGQTLIPTVAVDQPDEEEAGSAGQEPCPSPGPPEDSVIDVMESTVMWGSQENGQNYIYYYI